MNKLFDSNPKIENSKYRIRLIRKKDLKQLIKLYGNKENLKNINVDDCNGDTFYYPTEELLMKKYLFWKHAYQNRWFIRQVIFSKIDNRIIGTIEYLKRKGYDSFENAIVIRLDLLLEFEKKDLIKEILELVLSKQLSNCNYSKIAIKANDDMEERIGALNDMGFKLSNRKLIGLEDNKQYKNYYIKK